jgi:multidrug resistance protein, MATE family
MKSEIPTIARHAGTVLVGQLAVMAFGVCDTVVAGHHSNEALAALSVGTAVYVSVYVGLMGMLQALLPIWAKLHGAQRHADVGRALRQSLYLAAACSILGGATLQWAPATLLRWTQVPESQHAVVLQYLQVLSAALPPALLFRLFSTLNQSLGKPRLVTWLQLGALAVKIPLSLYLAFGGVAMLGEGAVGCAWATLVVNYGMLALAVWALMSQDFYAPYRLLQRMEKPDWPMLKEIAHIGVPSGLAILVEVSSFTLMSMFVARQGTLAAASQQIASNLAGVLYMVPLSLGIATSARVGYWLGARQGKQARSAAHLGLLISAGMSVFLALSVVLGRHSLAGWYAHENPALVEVSSGLLVWIAIYHVADAVQAVCAFVLRCYGITLAPLLVYSVMLWGVSLYGGYALAYDTRVWPAMANSPAAFWLAATVALAVTTLIFLGLLQSAMQKSAPHGSSHGTEAG